MASQVTLKALGLNYSPNNLALPEGSLVSANDVIIRRDNVVESRRGFKEYSENFGISSDRSKQLIFYKDRILNHFASTLQYSTDTQNSDGKEIFNDFNGTYQELNDDGDPIRIKSIEANKNLYFTTTEGIKKISAVTGADFTTDPGFIRDAGAVKAIDFTATLNIKQGEQSGFLGFDSAVAYRILWGYKDLNDNLILGAPSDSVSVYNYLSNICALDINALCLALDKLQRNEANYYSVIHNISNNAAQDEEFPLTDTFSDKFYTKTTDTAEKMRTNVVNIAKYIDRYGRIADTSPASYDKPLEISTIEIVNNEAIIRFNPNVASVFSSTGFNAPYGAAKDSSGNIFVADTGNHVIKKVNASGVSTVFAGSGVAGNTDGTGVAATFDSPRYIVIDSSDNLYVVDSGNHNVRKITSAGVVTTFAGSNAAIPVSGDLDGTGTAARFNGPYGICLDPFGNLYVTDTGNRKIKKIDAGAVVTTIAGSGAAGGVNGTGINASFNTPIGIATDGSNLFVSDSVNCNIRKITISGFVVSTFAGYSVAAKEKTKLAINNPATYFNVEGTAKYFVLNTPNPATKHCFYYEKDATKQTAPTGVGVLHKIDISTSTTPNDVANRTQLAINAIVGDFTATVLSNEVTVTNVSNGTVPDVDVATSGITGTVIEQGSDASSGSISGNDDGVGVAAKFNAPTGLYIDDQKIIYVSDTGNNSIRKVSSTAVVDTLIPITSSYSPFSLVSPTSSLLNSEGSLFILESGNNRIDKLSPISPKTVFTVGDKIEILGADAPFDVLNSNKIDQVSKYYTLTNVTDNTIVFAYNNDNVPASIPSSDTDIYSYDFRYIVESVQYDITSSNNVALASSLSAMVIPENATQDIYANIISNVYYIIFKLKSKTNATLNNYISQSLQDMYLKNLNITNSGSVDLTINVPQSIRGSNDYFLQIYRTATFTATDGQILGVDVTPDEEMNLVEEVLIDGSIDPTIFRNDTYPDDLRGFNTPLYTNPTTGEGALQANEQPPIAKDLNRFKNVVFYANTKTKQRFTGLTLLGTSGIQSGDKIIIANSTKSNEYEFVSGQFEQNVFSFSNTASVSGLLNKHFILNSTNDNNSYYLWYRKDSKNLTFTAIAQGSPSTTTEFTTSFNHNLSIGDYVLITGVTGVTSTQNVNGTHLITNVTAPNKFTIGVNITGIVPSLVFTNAYAEPTVPNKIGCVIDVLTADTPKLIRNKTIDAINSLSLDFSATKNIDIIETSGSGTNITIKTLGNHGFVTGDNITLSDIKNANGVSIGIDGNYVVGAGVTANSNILNIVIASPLTSQGTSGTITSNNPWKLIVSNTSEGIVTAPNAGNISGSILTITQIEQGAGEDAANKKILLSQVTSRAQAIDLTARSMVRVINQTPSNNSAVNAYYGSSANTLPGIMNFESVSLSDDPFYVMASNSSVGASFNPNIGPLGTAVSSIQRSLVDTKITSTSHGLINGDKIVLMNTDIPNTTGIFTVSKINNNVFSIPVTGSALTKSQGAWSKLIDTVISTNETRPNRIYYSKILQPEAVPLLNALDVGAEDQKILRIFPLRDSLFVFKEDGLYRISGETAPFVVTLFDSSCILIAPDSVSVANNIIYAWTNKGISNITESGVNEISRPIDTVVLKLASSNYKNFKAVTWGLGYDSDNSYTVYTNTTVDDDYATIGFRFSNLTNTWTNFVRSQTCGVISLKDDKIYTGSGKYNLIDQERKQFDRTDYADRDFTVDVPNTYINKDVSGHTTVALFDIDNLESGDVVMQEQKLTTYNYNSFLAKLDYDPGVSGYNFVDNLTIGTGANLRDALVALAAQLTISLPAYNYTNLIANSSGSVLSVTASNPALITTASPHNLQTGRYVTIAGTNSIPLVNNTYVITVVNATQFTIPVNVTTSWIGAGATFTTLTNSQYANDVAACFNIIAQTLNKPTSGTAFKDYKEITESQLFEAVISSIDKKNKVLHLNLPLDLVVGKMQMYKAIPCEMQYAPITMGDPLLLKQIYEATMMFNNKAFTKATASFSSDLKPQFFNIDFYGQGNGIFGHYSDPGFGFGFFGGSSNAAPFRTIVPRESQRCRFMNVKYSHSVAREIWSLYGITLTATDSTSKRAYR